MAATTHNTRRRHIIINADDFGMSAPVNAAVIQAFERQLISSATVMANMPGFDEACTLVRSHNLGGKIGLHLNFTDGAPLSSDIAGYRRFCDKRGRWLPRRKVLSLSRREKGALECEIMAQVRACNRGGIILTHWDSHHHMHTEPGIASVVIPMAKRLGARAIRPGLNYGPGRIGASATHQFLAQRYRDLFNMRLAFHGLSQVKYFAELRRGRELIIRGSGSIELMVHPIFNSSGQLVDSDGQCLEERVKSLGIPASEMSSYGDVIAPAERCRA